MILAQFRPALAANRPYTVELERQGKAFLETVKTMVLYSHVIETKALSGQKPGEGLRVMRLRRLILIGLAIAMAFATLAPAVVLAG